VTSNCGLILVRKLDERLGLEKLFEERSRDSRQGLNKQFTLADLPRQSVYSRLAGYEDLNDAERPAAGPTFRLISSQRIWDRSAALTSTLHWFETELLTKEENLIGLMALNRGTLVPALVANPVCLGQEKFMMCEPDIQIGHSGYASLWNKFSRLEDAGRRGT
jgi:hypothetical protein